MGTPSILLFYWQFNHYVSINYSGSINHIDQKCSSDKLVSIVCFYPYLSGNANFLHLFFSKDI